MEEGEEQASEDGARLGTSSAVETSTSGEFFGPVPTKLNAWMIKQGGKFFDNICLYLHSDSILGELVEALYDKRHGRLRMVSPSASHLNCLVFVSRGRLSSPVPDIIALDLTMLEMEVGGKPEHLKSFASTRLHMNSLRWTWVWDEMLS